jgi:hydroxymethylpyrimidine/phosphomethylpyrimidine kinase
VLPIALTVAGSDPSGGAGIQADLKTFHQHGVYGTAVISLLTVQNTLGVKRVEGVRPAVVAEQLRAVLEDVPPAAAKVGALGSAEVVATVAEGLRGHLFPLVVDPVMISKHGAPLLDDDARGVLVQRLLPITTLLTPNAHEAAALCGADVTTVPQAREAARRIAAMGPAAVLVKGGHLEGPAVDVLWADGHIEEIPAERVPTPHTHGTGCTYSAAITAWLARGLPLREAVVRAKAWLTETLRTAPGIGQGVGPVNHLAPVPPAASNKTSQS